MKINTDEDTNLFSKFSPPSIETWREVAVASLKGAPYEKKVITKTLEGIDLQPIYWAEDIEDIAHVGGLPGAAPYVRGSEGGGYLAKPWLVCQELAASTPRELNADARDDLERGQTALGIVLDDLTRRGVDADRAGEQGAEIGVGGVSLCCLDDFRAALDGIDLGSTSLHIIAGATALPTIAHVAALCGGGGESSVDLRGLIGADPLGELASHGGLPFGLEVAYDDMAATAHWAKEHAPKLQTIAVRGCPYHDGGASTVQELAAALATAAEYIRSLSSRGVALNDATSQLRFTFSLGSNYFMEVAKLRAARLLFAQLVEAFGGDEAAQKMTIHGRTSGANMTIYDPYVNLLRNTTEAFSGIVGGVDSLFVRPFDEPHRPADEFSRRVSRNIQLLLSHEGHATVPIDPAGGSYFVEVLTDQVGKAAWALFQEVEGRGGMAKTLKEGWIQAKVSETASQRAALLEKRRTLIIGTNTFANLKERPLEVPDIDTAARRKARVAALDRFRKAASKEDHSKALAVFAGEKPGARRVDRAIEAVEAGCTLGDLFRSLQGDESTAGPTVTKIEPGRFAEPFEQLRNNAAYWASHGRRLTVFLANIGPIPQHKARADFTRGFFEVGGLEVIGNDGFASPDEASEAALQSKAPIVVICSTDSAYPDTVAPLTQAIKSKRPETIVVLAGRPSKEHEGSYREAGLDHAIYLGCNCYELLRILQVQNGVTDERPE